eukprot:TRINITY_DN1906_c0_g4_i1.p1 TRINITY_DN1906_c0_g4~~TRINITY_DN1906_c0_g4_i1.p1  ORF type:complete len:480 (-),score=71.06 TRINITY_DN1906_c0_g4_i1:127-1566(-)
MSTAPERTKRTTPRSERQQRLIAAAQQSPRSTDEVRSAPPRDTHHVLEREPTHIVHHNVDEDPSLLQDLDLPLNAPAPGLFADPLVDRELAEFHVNMIFDYALSHSKSLANDLRDHINIYRNPDSDARIRASVHELRLALLQGQYHILFSSLKNVWPLGWSTSPNSSFFRLCLEIKTQICLQPLRSSPPTLTIQGVLDLLEKSFPIHEAVMSSQDEKVREHLIRRRGDLHSYFRGANSATDDVIVEVLDKYSLEAFNRMCLESFELLESRMIRNPDSLLEIVAKMGDNFKAGIKEKYPMIMDNEIWKAMRHHHHLSDSEARSILSGNHEQVIIFKEKAEQPDRRFAGLMKTWLGLNDRAGGQKRRRDSEPAMLSHGLSRHDTPPNSTQRTRRLFDPHHSAVRAVWDDEPDLSILNLSARQAGRRFWTDEEEKNLIEGVKRFGIGNWTKILSNYEFQGRKALDLKDKWRNLAKSGRIKLS